MNASCHTNEEFEATLIGNAKQGALNLATEILKLHTSFPWQKLRYKVVMYCIDYCVQNLMSHFSLVCIREERSFWMASGKPCSM